MFRPSLFAGLALALALLMASSASAQFGRGIQISAVGAKHDACCATKPCRRNWRSTEDQTKAHRRTGRPDAVRSHGDHVRACKTSTPEEREKEMPDLMKMIDEKGKELQEKVDKVLDAKQVDAAEGAVDPAPRRRAPWKTTRSSRR